MTPAQLDHLSRIKRHLETLLANAKKRTPGEWETEDARDGGIIARDLNPPDHVLLYRGSYLGKHDAAYIASCASNAEAGWRSTLAAIKALLTICDPASGADYTNYGDETLVHEILAAWPIENLP